MNSIDKPHHNNAVSVLLSTSVSRISGFSQHCLINILRFPALQVVTSNTLADVLKSDKISHSWLEENKECEFINPSTESWRNTWRNHEGPTTTPLGLEPRIFPVQRQDNFTSASHQLLKAVTFPEQETQSAWPECTSHTGLCSHHLLSCLFPSLFLVRCYYWLVCFLSLCYYLPFLKYCFVQLPGFC